MNQNALNDAKRFAQGLGELPNDEPLTPTETRRFKCTWGDGYDNVKDSFGGIRNGMGWFANEMGYDNEARAKIEALAVGETADLSDLSGVHTVTREA